MSRLYCNSAPGFVAEDAKKHVITMTETVAAIRRMIQLE